MTVTPQGAVQNGPESLLILSDSDDTGSRRLTITGDDIENADRPTATSEWFRQELLWMFGQVC
ncbi:hypothetical protein [Synechococcus sp. KORDI-100]|uniref:hypothetical protein n=1 Tax=Synechococcus sp. KORDI-100 TaxID=1280380 RepID=UPI00138E1140|nr:hypothetical protein [Synechococcus sp. KORDI-100]